MKYTLILKDKKLDKIKMDIISYQMRHCSGYFILLITGMIVSSVTYVDSQTTPTCTQEKVNACIRVLDKYKLNEPFFPQLTRTELTKMCSDFSTAESCLRPFRSSCDLFQRRHYEGVESAYSYVCGDGFEIYLGNYDCYGLVPLRNRVNACNTTFQSSKTQVQTDAFTKTFDDMQKEQCKRMNTYMYCIRDTIADRCGAEAGDWQLEVNKRSIERVLSEMNCQIGRPVLNGGEIAGIVIGILVLIIIVVVVIYLCTCNVWRFKDNRGKREQEKKVQPLPQTQYQGHNLTAANNLGAASLPKKSSLKSPASSRRAAAPDPSAPEAGGDGGGEVTARSSNTPLATRLKLNLSFADELHSTYETLPPTYTSAMADDDGEDDINHNDDQTEDVKRNGHAKLDIF